ncbi:hypothetical protein FS837_007839 [Tulasnella sp. UAMH 9824]|nr:hypothetical protein FS837_007839 [Tulasnella sp. UAMH 9824]
MKVFAVGASRNIGYYSFDNDTEIQPFVASGHVKLIKGDAMVEEDVRNAWTEANADGAPVDLVLFTVGAPPIFAWTKGWVIDPLSLCSATILNVLSVLPRDPAQQQPRLIAVTSVGVTRGSHARIPFLFKGIYAMLKVPHADKLGMEKAIHWSAGWEWKDKEPSPHATA